MPIILTRLHLFDNTAVSLLPSFPGTPASRTCSCCVNKKTIEAAHAFHTMRSPTEEDRDACAVLAQALVDGSDEAEEALEVGAVVIPSRQQSDYSTHP